MPHAEREPYNDMAVAHQATFKRMALEANNPEALAEEHTGEWSIGLGMKPLTDACLREPPFTAELGKAVEGWAASYETVIMHIPDTLPYTTTSYRKACVSGMCMRSTCYGKAALLSDRFRSLVLKDSIGSAHLMFGEGHQGPGLSCLGGLSWLESCHRVASLTGGST